MDTRVICYVTSQSRHGSRNILGDLRMPSQPCGSMISARRGTYASMMEREIAFSII